MFKKMLQRTGVSSIVTLGAIVLVAGFAAPAHAAEQSVDDMFVPATTALHSGQNNEPIRPLTRAAQPPPRRSRGRSGQASVAGSGP